MKYFEEVSAVDQNTQNKFILKSFRLNLIFIFCFAFLVTLWDKKIATPNFFKNKIREYKAIRTCICYYNLWHVKRCNF